MMHSTNPRGIRLEASSVCQLRCPSCPTTSQAIHPVIGRGFLKPADFRKLLDQNPGLREIELSNYGEIFLNPNLLEILRHAQERGVALSANNGVNLNHARADVLEGLVRHQLKSMNCSIDGASNETYKIYRVRGDFDTVLQNLKKINEHKAAYRSKYPRLNWQFVVFGHNEHEIPLARSLARELGMSFRLKLSWDEHLSPPSDVAALRKEIGAASRQEYKSVYKKDYMQAICHQLWDQPQINWDGKLLGCCRNFWGDFGGNAFEDGLAAALNHEKMSYAKEMLQGRAAAREDIPCTSCEIYLGMKADQRWLKRGLRSLLRSLLRRLR